MAKQTKLRITEIPEGQLFKWNRVIYRKTIKDKAIDTRTGKEIGFYDECKGIIMADSEHEV